MTEDRCPPPVIPGSVLILGGTAEARALAAAVPRGLPIISSLAGRVSNPALPPGPVRIGGFGGPDGLTDYLTRHRISAVVDATHPFAATISASAATACGATGLPLLRLARPGWSGHPDAADWHWVSETMAACTAAAELGSRTFLTTGRQSLPQFLPLSERYVLVRVVEPPPEPLPSRWELVRDRGPYSPAAERDLMSSRTVDVLVTKDSGGSYTAAKLDAAAQLGVAVVVVRRPEPISAVTAVHSVPQALDWLTALRV